MIATYKLKNSFNL